MTTAYERIAARVKRGRELPKHKQVSQQHFGPGEYRQQTEDLSMLLAVADAAREFHAMPRSFNKAIALRNALTALDNPQ